MILSSERLSEPMLVELDGCEIRTGAFAPAGDRPHDEQSSQKKTIKWRDVRVGLARPMSSQSKPYAAQMQKYPEVVSQLFSIAAMLGMTVEQDRASHVLPYLPELARTAADQS
jgi:hypothetical protein